MIILDISDFVTMRKQMRTRNFNGYHNANGQEQESFQRNPGGFWRKFKPKRDRGHIGDNVSDFWHSEDKMVRVARLVQEISSIDGISKISVRKDSIEVFFVKKTQQKTFCSKHHEFTERLDLLQKAFETEGLESNVLKTWTPPKDNACERKWKRFYRRLCDSIKRNSKKSLLK